MKIYLASSWRNPSQADVLGDLRKAGHQVYDFKNPAPGNSGFSWQQIDPSYSRGEIPERNSQSWSAEWMQRTLAHPVAQAGFDLDFNAMKWADVCVLLLPCGLSAHMEAAWFAGARKPVAILAPEIREPELMYKLCDVEAALVTYRMTPVFSTIGDVIGFLENVSNGIYGEVRC